MSIKSFVVKLMFDISIELSTKTIKRLYYYSVTVFYVKKTLYRYLPGTSVKPPAIIKPAQNSIIIDLE